MFKFLSTEWREHLWEVLRRDRALSEASREIRFTLQQVVHDVPRVGDARYWVQVAEGSVDGGPGEADASDVAVIQSYDTALRLVRGDLDPHLAFVQGLIEIKGDFHKLTEYSAVVNAIASAVKAIPTEF